MSVKTHSAFLFDGKEDCMEQSCYPQNLIDALASKYLYKPKLITDDVMAGINYALFTLKPIEQKFIELRFQSDLSLDDISEELKISVEDIEDFEDAVIKKLRHPWVYHYITHGIVGYTLYKSIKEFFNGYQNGYADAKEGKEDLTYNSRKPGFNLDTPSIEILQLSQRTFNCLTRAGITTIGDCLMLRTEDIRGIRGLGPVGSNEVSQALVDAHIFSYNWEQFLSEPRSSRDMDEFHVEVM